MTTSERSEPGWRENTVRTGGILTRYLEAGDRDADPVILLHDGAWGASASASWGNFIHHLAPRYRVIAPDLIGFGGTDKAVFLDRPPVESRIDQVESLLESLGVVGPAHLVGCSFGGAVALRWLVRSHTRVSIRSVTSIAGAGGARPRTRLALAELGRWDGSRADLTRVVRLLVDDFAGFEAQVDERFRWARSPGHYRAVMAATVPLPDSLKTDHADPWPQQLAGTLVPILLVRGLRDELLDADWPDQIRAVVPHSRIVDLDARHAPQIDQPARLAEVLIDFLGGGSASP